MKITLILSFLTCASATNRGQFLCVQRCNQLPFKVAVDARRASCIEGCNSTVTLNNTSEAIQRDIKCVKKCNARKTPYRKTTECIERCPEVADATHRKTKYGKTNTKKTKEEGASGDRMAVTKDELEMHPSLPMLNISDAFRGAEEEQEHPSLPMLSLNRNAVATDS